VRAEGEPGVESQTPRAESRDGETFPAFVFKAINRQDATEEENIPVTQRENAKSGWWLFRI
jgi:hypothetical protein